NGWTPITTDKASAFKGDAVMSNGRILAIVRNQSSTVEVYSEGQKSPIARLQLRLLTSGGEPATQLDRVALIENSRGGAGVEVSYKTAQGASLGAKFRIKRGEVFVQTEPGAGAGRL